MRATGSVSLQDPSMGSLAQHSSTSSARCRDIKHLYHYYLHGPLGRRPGQSGPATVNDGVLPDIIIQCTHNSHLKWRYSLVDVSDDMESKYLEVRADPSQWGAVDVHLSFTRTLVFF